MLRVIPHIFITPSFTSAFISRIKEKMDIFLYICEDKYADSMSDGTYIVYQSGENGVIVARPTVHETGRVSLTLDACTIDGSKLRGAELAEAVEELVEMARDSGYHRLVINGRAGWKKVLPDFKHCSTSICKEL